ncbi:MAG: OmpA family protein [Vicinamibacterales bacterium]
MTRDLQLFGLALSLSVALAAARPSGQTASVDGSDAVERTDYLTFAQGAVPVGIGGGGAKLGADYEAAVRITDGARTGFTVVDQAPEDTETEFVYELPALTTFDRFAVPEIRETPSPSATFTRRVEVLGSRTSATDGFVRLASATLEIHSRRGAVTELSIEAKSPVRWIKLRLAGGINVLRPLSSFEFSEIIGNGTQEPPALATTFHGGWRTQALTLSLDQKGPVVSGCYDRTGKLTGTVTGNILRATGATPAKIPSAFILSVAPDGGIRGVRSSNGGPFRLYTLAADAGTTATCTEPPPPAIGCGAVIHGIAFDFDSATIRPDSEAVLAELYRGLQADSRASILIEGHTSSEGAEAYNRQLSQRRAQAVVDDLLRRGIAKSRLSASGAGESRPIAPNTDESGRSMNRRVEVHCT